MGIGFDGSTKRNGAGIVGEAGLELERVCRRGLMTISVCMISESAAALALASTLASWVFLLRIRGLGIVLMWCLASASLGEGSGVLR